MTIRILIADDHAVVRRGLKDAFEEAPGLKVEAQAATGAEVLEKICHHKFDVVIMDISMPGRSGLELLEEIKRHRNKTRVIVFTMHGELEFASRAAKAGASGYLTKECPLEEVVTAVRKVMEGGKYFSASVAEQLLLGDAWGCQGRHEELSNREYQIMLRIAAGVSLKQIAAELSLSAKTVTSYRRRILEKMNLQTNAALTHYVLTHRLAG